MVIAKYTYISTLSNFQLDVATFVDFSKFRVINNLNLNLDCGVIMIFLYGTISHISVISEDFKTIADSLTQVI
jgi:hypothetical protein